MDLRKRPTSVWRLSVRPFRAQTKNAVARLDMSFVTYKSINLNTVTVRTETVLESIRGRSATNAAEMSQRLLFKTELPCSSKVPPIRVTIETMKREGGYLCCRRVGPVAGQTGLGGRKWPFFTLLTNHDVPVLAYKQYMYSNNYVFFLHC